MMREYKSLALAAQAAQAGEFGCGTRVLVEGVEHVLTELSGGAAAWGVIEAAPDPTPDPIPPLRKFASILDVRAAVQCGALGVGAEYAYADSGTRATIAAIDADEFVVVYDDGAEMTFPFGAERCNSAKPVTGWTSVTTERTRTLPDDDTARKAIPMFSGCVLYFPAALAEVAKISLRGNAQHNPGQPLHWARGKSMAQMDSALHHMIDAAESTSADRVAHLAANAWRALAELQIECEAQGAPRAPNARTPTDD